MDISHEPAKETPRDDAAECDEHGRCKYHREGGDWRYGCGLVRGKRDYASPDDEPIGGPGGD